MMTLQNTEGYTQEQLDALNAEFASRCESGYYDWIGTDDEAMDQAAKEFRDEVARRRAGAILDSVDLWGRNTIADYQKMLTDNPDTTIGFTLAADMIYTARYGEIKRSEARGGDKWRTIAKNLKREYGESLSVDEVRSEMSPAKIAAAILGSVKSPKKTAAARANGARGGRPRQMTAEETALFIEEQSVRLCNEHLGYTPTNWYQGGPGHNDDRLEAMITACGDIRVTDGGETKFYTGSRTRPAVRRFVKDWLENLWDEKLEE